jgi:hypothetical protein
MNGFASHGLDDDAFGEKRGNIVQAFDAFRKYSCLNRIAKSICKPLELLCIRTSVLSS